MLCVAVLFSTIQVAPAQDLQANESPSSIRGTVINSVTHMPVPRALVFAFGDRYAKLTDADGHFEFVLPKAANAVRGGIGTGSTLSAGMLMARKPGYLDDPAGRSQVEPTPGAEIEIPLIPEAIIKGRVLSSETDPSPQIMVRLFSRQVQEGMPRWIQGKTARTNANGEFRFAELQPGSYKVVTTESLDNDPASFVPGGQRFGFPPVHFPGVADFGSAATIQVAAGQTVQADIQITRQPYYPVKIAVAGGDTAFNGLMINVLLQGHRAPEYSLGYNSEKHEVEGLLPNGNYLIEANTFGPSSSLSGSSHLAVSGGPAEGSALTLVPNNSIPVHVTEEFTDTGFAASGTFSADGKNFELHGPRAYLNIYAEPTEDLVQRPGFSLRPPSAPNDESLVLQNVVPGRYWVRFHPNHGYVAAASMGGVDLLRQPIVISAGSSAAIEVTVRDDMAELDGSVSGVDARAIGQQSPFRFTPQGNAGWVYCVPLRDSTGQFQQVWISPEGKFSVNIMAPGGYRIFAFKKQQPNLPYRDAEAMKAYDSKGQVVQLSPGEKTSVQLQLITDNE